LQDNGEENQVKQGKKLPASYILVEGLAGDKHTPRFFLIVKI
jgi:hypothetical protein